MRYFKNNKGIFYIVVVFLCVANFILGFELIKNIVNKNSSLPNVSKSTVVELRDKDFFVGVLASSNSYMNAIIKQDNESVQLNNRLKNILYKPLKTLTPRSYIKTQLPAIIALVDTDDVRVASNIYNGNNNKENSKYEDLIYIDDTVEEYEGKVVESKKDLISSEKPTSIKIDDKNPYILIYHSHATESYYPNKQNNYHVDQRDKNVIAIGELMGKTLQEKGHKVKHIDTYHDLPNYNQSYANSLATLKRELSKNDSLKFLLDVHRDGFDENSISINQLRKAARVDINGKSVATFSFVIGPDNPNKDELLKFTRYIRDKANEKYPGLCRGIIVMPAGRFNQYFTNYSTLIEVGSNLNTMDEAKESAKLIAEILDEVITELKEDK